MRLTLPSDAFRPAGIVRRWTERMPDRLRDRLAAEKPRAKRIGGVLHREVLKTAISEAVKAYLIQHGYSESEATMTVASAWASVGVGQGMHRASRRARLLMRRAGSGWSHRYRAGLATAGRSERLAAGVTAARRRRQLGLVGSRVLRAGVDEAVEECGSAIIIGGSVDVAASASGVLAGDPDTVPSSVKVGAEFVISTGIQLRDAARAAVQAEVHPQPQARPQPVAGLHQTVTSSRLPDATPAAGSQSMSSTAGDGVVLRSSLAILRAKLYGRIVAMEAAVAELRHCSDVISEVGAGWAVALDEADVDGDPVAALADAQDNVEAAVMLIRQAAWQLHEYAESL